MSFQRDAQVRLSVCSPGLGLYNKKISTCAAAIRKSAAAPHSSIFEIIDDANRAWLGNGHDYSLEEKARMCYAVPRKSGAEKIVPAWR